LYRFGGVRYAGVGTTFINADSGVVLKTGLSGNRLSFAKMPAQLGGPDYLFVADGASPFKMDLAGNVSNWGIQAPPDGFVGVAGTKDIRVIDTFNGSAASYTLIQPLVRVQKADDTTLDGGDLELDFSGSNHWRLRKALTIDLSTYGDGRISLPTDAIAITIEQNGKGFVNFGLRLRFYLDPATRTDYYEAVVSLISQTASLSKGNQIQSQFGFDFAFPMALGDVETIRVPKSAFRRVGSGGKGWESVGQVEIGAAAMSLSAADYGNTVGSATNFGSSMYIQNWQLEGSYPLNGTVQYAVTYRNLTTGSRSNANPNYITVSNVDRAPVTLSNLPISTDSQVNAREIWRAVAVQFGGALSNKLFLVAAVGDNSTTTYTDDHIADIPIPFTVNVWKAGFTIPAVGFFVDGGNGYYFKASAGTTGGSVPAWNVPNTGGFFTNYPYVVGNTIFPANSNTSKRLFKVTAIAGTKLSGATEPNWDSVAVGASVTSGGVTFTNQGTITTIDNTVTWTLQGINSLQTLQGTQLPLDNAPVPSTTLRTSSPYQGVMFTVDSANPGRVDYSAPGRPESFGGFVQVTDPDDPIQTFIIHNGNLYVWSQQRVFFLRILGTNILPGLTQVLVDYNSIEGAPGTIFPFSVAACNQFVAYQAMEGLMKFDGATAVEFGMEALGPVFRGESAENLVPMKIATATYHDGEYICSDAQTQTLAIDVYTERWRSIGAPVNALYTEQDTTSLLSTLAENIVLLEEPGQLQDNGMAVPIDWQTASVRLATSQQATVQRLYLDINPNGATLIPTLILDNASIPLPPLVGTGRKNPPYEWTLGLSGQMIAVELKGTVLNGIIELFGVEFDVEAGVK
jgi:hypothetical protein